MDIEDETKNQNVYLDGMVSIIVSQANVHTSQILIWITDTKFVREKKESHKYVSYNNEKIRNKVIGKV